MKLRSYLIKFILIVHILFCKIISLKNKYIGKKFLSLLTKHFLTISNTQKMRMLIFKIIFFMVNFEID